MNVFIHARRHVEVHYQFDVDQVKPSAQDPCADHDFKLPFKKTLHGKIKSDPLSSPM